MAKILVAEDDPSMREFLSIFLSREGHEVVTANSGEEAVKLLDGEEYDLVMTDLKMQNISGIELLERAKEAYPATEVIIITAFSTVETAVEAMKKGAYDYITKPFKIDELKVLINKCIEKRALYLENMHLRRELRERYKFDKIIGKSKKMQEIFDIILRVAPTKTSVLLCGESGTGKELVARSIHYNSPRRDRPFVVINCGAIPDTLLESELFGHVKGAFTGAYTTKKGLFEIASGGSVFLDEIGELSPMMQVKLLRVLQERKIKMVGGVNEIDVDVRVIAATNKELEKEVERGTFREDLFYRLNVIQIRIPPLRERREDIPYLARHFVEKYSKEMNKKIQGLSKEVMEILYNYKFTGNVRELENIIEHAATFEQNGLIKPESLPHHLRIYEGSTEVFSELTELPETGLDLEKYLSGIEKSLLLKALEKTNGVRKDAAKLLNISFRSIRYKLSKYDINE